MRRLFATLRADRQAWAFRFVYCVLGLALLAGAAGFGRGWAWTKIVNKPAHCVGVAGLTRCVSEEVKVTTGMTPTSLVCHETGKGQATCDLKAPDPIYGVIGCYVLVIEITKEGVPIIEAGSQKPC